MSLEALERASEFAGPKKPEIPEKDVLTYVAAGQTESPEAIFRRNLDRRGLKFTQERREILRSVMSTHEHFDADWLFMRMRKVGAKTSKATIYRSLALLCETGLLREVFHGPHGAYYEHVYGHEHHEHMICLKCNKVIEFISKQLEQLQDEACRSMGFHAMRHHLQVFGFCSDCHPCRAAFPPIEESGKQPH